MERKGPTFLARDPATSELVQVIFILLVRSTSTFLTTSTVTSIYNQHGELSLSVIVSPTYISSWLYCFDLQGYRPSISFDPAAVVRGAGADVSGDTFLRDLELTNLLL